MPDSRCLICPRPATHSGPQGRICKPCWLALKFLDFKPKRAARLRKYLVGALREQKPGYTPPIAAPLITVQTVKVIKRQQELTRLIADQRADERGGKFRVER